MDNTHEIISIKGHYEAYNSSGKFVVSGDTYDECERELINMLIADAKRAVVA